MTIIFCLVSGAAIPAALLWVLHKAGVARRRTINPPAGFFVGVVIFALIYGFSRFNFPLRPRATAAFNLAVLLSILLLPWLRKKARSLKPKDPRHQQLHVEIKALERMLTLDPLNTFCHEKLSELYEKMGRLDLALKDAREAARLDPSVKNRGRVEELVARIIKKD